MTKVLIAIFAHPDDEAFGPSGTLLQETRAGTALHLISLTLGDAGSNPDNHHDLAEVREQEWRAAGKLMGATSLRHLGYRDGQLNNQSMIEIGEKLVEVITDLTRDNTAIDEIELMTNDLNGISGHIDHIVAARAACWAFYKLKQTEPRLTRIRLSCVPNAVLAQANINWLYMEAGRGSDEIDETIDNRGLYDEIVAIMRCHQSQRADGEMHIKMRGHNLAINHFIVKT